MYKNSRSTVIVDGEDCDMFDIIIGVRQGDVLLNYNLKQVSRRRYELDLVQFVKWVVDAFNISYNIHDTSLNYICYISPTLLKIFINSLIDDINSLNLDLSEDELCSVI
eukprot:Pgem_evm1s16950